MLILIEVQRAHILSYLCPIYWMKLFSSKHYEYAFPNYTSMPQSARLQIIPKCMAVCFPRGKINQNPIFCIKYSYAFRFNWFSCVCPCVLVIALVQMLFFQKLLSVETSESLPHWFHHLRLYPLYCLFIPIPMGIRFAQFYFYYRRQFLLFFIDFCQ